MTGTVQLIGRERCADVVHEQRDVKTLESPRDSLEIDIRSTSIRNEILDVQSTRGIDGLHLLDRPLYSLLVLLMEDQIEPPRIQLLRGTPPDPIRSTSDKSVRLCAVQ